MSSDELDEFLALFCTAIQNVDGEYMRTIYHEMAYVVDIINNENQQQYMRRNVVGNDIVRTGERIFCYELYHQLRLLMGPMRDQFPHLYLQGELRKHQVPELLEAMNIGELDGNYMPDFLLHTPGSTDDHPYVIEVKTDRFLTYPQVTGDLKKVVQFMCEYNYQRGIFLTANTSSDFVDNHFRNNNTIRQIGHIQQFADQIYIINVEHEHAQPTVRLLSSWL
ncbi:MAG TPA: hypothetical protein VHC47_07600 [Mucilaginibacter sp.]|nr:hypothetical protein [Mucilaginibacter sp.]